MSAFWKDLFREIKNTPGRFLSLLIITALGATSIVGIQAASIDMQAIADKTYKEHNLYDLQIKSTMGFDEDDIAALTDMEGVYALMPTTIFDAFVGFEGENRAVRTYALPDTINTIDLTDGRLPENSRECVVERRLLRDVHIAIGDEIRLGLDDMGDYYDVFADDTFTVVGIVSSPLYISLERGNTSLGDGSLQYYMYLHPDAYVLDVFTDVYLLMDGSREADNLTNGYYAAANEWNRQAERTGDLRVDAKRGELDDAQREIDDGWDDYNDGVRELDEKLAEGRTELEDARIKLVNASADLRNGQRELDESVANGLNDLENRERELAEGQVEINERRTELTNAQTQLDAARAELNAALEELAQIAPQGAIPQLDAHYEEIYAGLRELDEKQAQLDEGKTALDTAQTELNDGARQIAEGRETLETERVKAQREIADGWAKYYSGLSDYNDGVQTLETEEADVRIELADAKHELEDAQEKLDDAPHPEWFYFTRKDGLSYDSYYQDTLRLQKIGYVFPLVFFLVAILVSLTSMSRMVEEHRTQIGIYKALGYRPAAIMMKYLIYAFGASLFGGLAGVILGSKLFPYIISDAYGHLYNLPPVEMPVPADIAAVAVAAGVLSVVLVTLWTGAASMLGTPALLMRPKSPQSGKRVWLERIPFIWRRLGFFSKVTSRNIFRYKKRFIMTLVGVAGCSALLLTAFGLRDSISGIATLQFESIVRYDARAYLKDVKNDRQRTELDALLPASHLYIREEAVTASGESGALSASVIVPEAPGELGDFISLYNPETGEPVAMTDQSVLITEKLSRVTGAGVGDGFSMTLSGGKTLTAVVTGVVDNYVEHYIYMAPAVYAGVFEAAPSPNGVLIFYENGRDFTATLLENGNVRAVIHNSDIMKYVGDSTNAMDIVTVVLIVVACALALVVLFNLTNINISERIRELATIKVLGFNDSELSMYIYRENSVVTLLGIALGLVAGIFLHAYVITTVEIDILKFPKIIHPQSYMLAAAFSLVFAVFVNLVMNRRLARIDMVESLKNVE